LEAQNFSIIIEKLSPEYFLSMILKPSGNLGRARLELKQAIVEMAREV